MLAAVVFATSLAPRIAGLRFEATPRVDHMQQHTEVGPNASLCARNATARARHEIAN
jgi:hypothetical protein